MAGETCQRDRSSLIPAMTALSGITFEFVCVSVCVCVCVCERVSVCVGHHCEFGIEHTYCSGDDNRSRF